MSKISELFEVAIVTENTKVCNKCKQEKSIKEFSFCNGGNYRRSECKTCANSLQKERKRLKSISPKLPENHICPICKKEEQELQGRGGKDNPAFVLDHCHDTKKFRGYICQSCNRALGTFHNIELLSNAIEYLKNPAVI
jgi:hypothetical protein